MKSTGRLFEKRRKRRSHIEKRIKVCTMQKLEEEDKFFGFRLIARS
jgi:hypothetical protein